MAAPGDSLLLRAGLVRPEHIAEAQRLRARSGGTIGEWLVRLGAVSEEQLVEFYHKRLLVPRIAPAQLARVSAEALASVPADMAAEFRVFPVGIDAQKALTLAMADPSDTHVAEEVAFYSGRFCHRAVAAPSAIQDAIERHYRSRVQARPTPAPFANVPTPVAETSVRTSLRETQRLAPIAVPPEEPVLLTHVKEETPPAAVVDAAVPTPIGKEPSAGRRRFVTQTRAAIVPRDLAVPVDEAPIPLTRAAAPPAPESITATPRPRARTLPGLTPLPDLPVETFRNAKTRDEIAFALLGYAAQLAPVAVLLVMRKGALIGHDGRGVEDLVALRALSIPVDEPSLFRDVVQSRLPYRGSLPDLPIHRGVAAALGRPPGDTLLLPVCVGDRVIALLYAAGIVNSLPDGALHDLGREAGFAYERLIRSARP